MSGDIPTAWIKPVKGKGDPDGWYAKFLEFGHFTRVGNSGKGKHGTKGKITKTQNVTFVKARPFIRTTFDSLEGTVRNNIDTTVTNEVEKFFT